MTACAVCDADLGDPIYRSSSNQALTSLCTILDQSTVVFSCPSCGHLQTPPIGDLEAYYATAYRILLESEEEDQIYAVVDGERVYRADHQAATLLDRVELPPAARVLDYGAAKGATMRKVRDARPDVDLHFFDVSDMYADYWRKIVDDEAWATFERPANWSGSFDAVASFFMLEHVERPREVVGAMFDLLRPGGVVYAVVPNPFVNVGDFVVVDHTNHFTRPSLDWLFAATGFDQISIDADAHSGAWVLSARRPTASSGRPRRSTRPPTWPMPGPGPRSCPRTGRRRANGSPRPRPRSPADRWPSTAPGSTGPSSVRTSTVPRRSWRSSTRTRTSRARCTTAGPSSPRPTSTRPSPTCSSDSTRCMPVPSSVTSRSGAIGPWSSTTCER